MDHPIGYLPTAWTPERKVPFTSPTHVSRFEGIKQVGTSMMIVPPRTSSTAPGAPKVSVSVVKTLGRVVQMLFF